MQFGDVLAQSVYGTTGYVADESDVTHTEGVLTCSLDVLRTFRSVVVATNYSPEAPQPVIDDYHLLWRDHFPNAVLLDSAPNRGHSIGTADLENALHDYCRRNDHPWLCKGANDVLLTPPVLTIPVQPAQFYFLNAVSYDALAQHDFDLSLFTDDFFFPQTTFYAIATGTCEALYDRRMLDASWRHVNAISRYNGRIWEYLPGWSCERWLRECALRNGLTRHHLMTGEQWRRVLDIVLAQRITDCSFKGLSINGICHVQGLRSSQQVQVV